MLARLGSLGVAVDDALPGRPVREVCTPEQLGSLLQFVAGADPIAEREALIDETLQQLADEMNIGPDRMLELCEAPC